MASEQRSERRLNNAFRDLQSFVKDNESLAEFYPLLPTTIEALRSHVEQIDSLALKYSIVDAMGRQSDGWKKLLNEAIVVAKKRSEKNKKNTLNMAAVEHFIENEISFVARGRFKEYLSKIAVIRLSTDEWRDLFDLLETIYDEIANGETELSEVEEEDAALLPKKEFVDKKEIEEAKLPPHWCGTGREDEMRKMGLLPEKPIVEEEKKD
jgi:hypothetical protein